jgi:hypothetical protein
MTGVVMRKKGFVSDSQIVRVTMPTGINSVVCWALECCHISSISRMEFEWKRCSCDFF